MLRRGLIGCLCAIPAYVLGTFGGGYLICLLSNNQHDRDVEAAMTGAFACGPAVAVLGFVVGLVIAKSRSRSGR